MSEEGSEPEDETYIENVKTVTYREIVSVDVVWDVHDKLIEYTHSMGLPILNSYGSGLALYDIIHSRH